MTRIDAHPIRVTDARLRLGEHVALDGVSLELEPGSLTAILGPNGAGKTSLLRALVGILPLTQGEVRIGDDPVHTLSRKEIARRVSYLPQSTEVPDGLTVEQVVWMGRYAHLPRLGSPSPQDHTAVEAALSRVGLAELRQRDLRQLSGGERQRALLARTLATQAPTWLLDEPTTSLDIAHALDILTLLRDEASGGRNIAVTLHDLGLALRFCDRFILLREAHLVAAGNATQTLHPDLLKSVYGTPFELLHLAGTPHLIVAPTYEIRPTAGREPED